MERVNNQGITIDVSANTSDLEEKLRVIAKHATALADDLKKLDEEKCLECGSKEVEVTRAYGDNDRYEIAITCFNCGIGSHE
ncbi:hypothetical protein ACWNS2_13815 [Planococcus plakortidis]